MDKLKLGRSPDKGGVVDKGYLERTFKKIEDASQVPDVEHNQIAARATYATSSLEIRMLRIAFNHENRIRALEGKGALTFAAFRALARTYTV